MEILTTVLGLLALLLYLFYRKRKREKCLLQNISVPGPHTEAHWFLGNILYPKDKYLQVAAWTKQYGKVYGFYEGPRPYLVVSDLDFLNEFMIKQFSHFTSRAEFPLEVPPNNMFVASGSAWKRLRYIINPVFTSAKLRQVSALMTRKVNVLMENIERLGVENRTLEIHDIYQRFTIDVIADVAFGMDMDVQKSSDNPFLKNCQLQFERLENFPMPLKIVALFPEIRKLMFYFFAYVLDKLVKHPRKWMIERFGEVIQHRREQKVKREDLLQLMMDATGNLDEITANGETTAHIRRTLTDEEMKSQSYLFLLAGYETSSNALTYLTYLLAMNPDKQDILRNEIDTHIQSQDGITHDSVMKLPYLDMCVTETLRMYPIAAGVVNRACTSPCTIHGLNIPVGTQMLADVWTIHHDPDIYPDPWEFKPERFSPENKSKHHPLQFLAFGAGPRNCIGMRFGLMEIKLAIVNVMKRYSFEKSEKTEDPIILKEGGTISPVNGVNITFIPREQT